MSISLCLAVPMFLGMGSPQEPMTLEAPVRRVRLHPDHAWITRRGVLQVGEAGSQRVWIRDLPTWVSLDDVRIAVRGPAGTRMGEVTLQRLTRPFTASPEWNRLSKELESVTNALEKLQHREQSSTLAETLFSELSEVQLSETRRLMASGGVKAQTLVDLVTALEVRRLELARGKFELDQSRAKLESQQAELQAALGRLQQEAEARPIRVGVDLEASRSGPVEVELSYRSQAASWSPTYEARLNADRTRMELVLLAAVRQQTEEDWQGVALELATQQASGALEMPATPFLPPLSFREGDPPKQGPLLETGPIAALAAFTFQIPGTVDVPRLDAQRFRVTSLDLEPTFRYLALPRGGTAVYLLALVSPPPDFPLLPGSALNLLQGQERLGALSLELPAPGEPLRLSFGSIPGVSAWIQRTHTGFQEVGEKAREREWTLQERVVVTNTLGVPAEVEVQDRRVMSATESITVDDTAGTTPGWREVQPGLRTWTLKVEPGQQGQLQLHTRIRGPLVGRILHQGDLKLEGNN